MVQPTICNDFLNNLFTTKEFDFINHMDSDNENIDIVINTEEHKRDLIVTFISDLIEGDSNAKLLEEVENIFALVNENINLLNSKKQSFDEINKIVVNLLINAESDSNSKDKLEIEISKLKDNINQYSNLAEEANSKILLNDSKIDEFINQYISTDDTSTDLDSDSSLPEKLNTDSKDSSIVESEYNDNCEFAKNNSVLLVSEGKKKVYLPYSEKEVLEYLEQFPNQYSSFDDVVKQEFILPFDFYMKHSVIARFRETYALIRDRESKSIVEAFKLAMDMMFRYDLNPTIIAACKTQEQLENYLSCLERKKLEEFSDFEIRFELMPI